MRELLLDSYEAFTHHLGDREYFGQKLGLERIERILDRLGHPEKKFSSIHVAGTNGKGSTCAMIAAILREAGYRVGLYTSPHLVDFCERIRIKGELIPRGQVLRYARLIHGVEEESLTFFEMATAIAFLHFAEEKVPIAVLETGLGGRLDATNVVAPLLSVITSIGLDHMEYLGDTLEKIAAEKAGIIKEGVPVFVGELPGEAMGVIERVAAEKQAPLLGIENPTLPPFDKGGLGGFRIGLVGAHQRENAALAVTAVEWLRRKKGFDVSDEAIRRGLEKVSWPGRLETIQEKPWILLDGAHNIDAMKVVRVYLEENLRGRHLKVIFGAMADKDIPATLSEIAPLAKEFIFTAPGMKRAAEPERLLEIAKPLGIRGSVALGVRKALNQGLQGLRSDEVLLVTGSLFVVGEVRSHLIATIRAASSDSSHPL